MKKHLLWLALSIMMPQVLEAQTIDLVKDINVNEPGNGIQVFEQAAAGNELFFIGSDGAHGTQLWKTDGTAAGTLRLTDISSDGDVQPFGLTTANGLAFCQINYGDINGYYLWLFRGDGTISGTYPLQINWIGLVDKNSLLEINGAIYYPNTGWENVHQLWKTNGNVEDPSLVKEFPGSGINSIGPYDFFNFNGVLYFLLGQRDGANTAYQLWKSDGTEAGTVPGPAFGSRFKPVALNGYMYYSENNSLKRTDGTTVTTIKSFTTLGDPTLVGATIYFSAQDGINGAELWKSDGTTAGTVLVKDINPGTNISSSPSRLTNVNGTLFFSAATSSNGRELWKSNGTAAGTVLVSDVNPGAEGNVQEIVAVGNQAVFNASNSSGPKVWKSDGTSAGTQIIADFYGSGLINAGGTLFFSGVENTVTRLYKSNLTSASTTAVPIPSAQGSTPQKIFDLNGTGYFTADNGIIGRELWKTNNTGAGTVLVKDINPGAGSSNPDQFTNVNGTLFFVNNAQEIWKSNGTSSGTVLLKDVISAPNDRITGLIGLNNTLYFGVITSAQTMQLWKSDGTAAGTVIVTTFPNSNNFEPVVLSGQIYFLAWDGVNSYELWKGNGTLAGTSVVKDMSSASGNTGRPVIANNYIYYILGDYASTEHPLIKSDGTAAGTTIVKNVFPGDNVIISALFAAGDLVYFSAVEPGQVGELLWRSDGTTAGTFQLASFNERITDDIHIRQKKDAGGKFFFVPYDFETYNQFWVSDGTIAGTHMVKGIGQYADEFTIDQSAAVGNILYFKLHDESTGTELWRSDGTSEGTYLVYDLTTFGSTYFYDLANVNGTLLISANVEQYGAELYKYVPAPVALRINSGGAAFAASDSRNFSTDQYFSGTTQLSTASSGDILNTTDDQLYKEQRFGSAFNYNIPVTNGLMNVVLHFAEIYWGVPGRGGSAGAGKRRFHVDIEGSRKLTNYDIFVSAGGAMRAKTETFTVNVTDGTLNIDFLTGSANNPVIAAIEVVPAGPIVLGPLADAYVRYTSDKNTNYGLATTLEIKTSSRPAYYRKTYLKFSLNGISQVSSAKLRIYGSNTQNSSNIGVSAYRTSFNWWTETGINWNNAPASSGSALGSVNVNNTAKYYEIDVTAYVQAQLAGNKVVSLFVTNTGNQNARLIFNSRENRIYRPQLVIETVAPPAARMGAEEEFVSSVPKMETSVIYPNPVIGRRFSAKVSGRHEGNVDLKLINLKGRPMQIQAKSAGSVSQAEMEVLPLNLSKGIYLLKIESKAHQEAIKILVTE